MREAIDTTLSEEIPREQLVEEATGFIESVFGTSAIDPDYFLAGVESGEAYLQDGRQVLSDPFRVAVAAQVVRFELDTPDGVPAYSFDLGFGFGYRGEQHKRINGELA